MRAASISTTCRPSRMREQKVDVGVDGGCRSPPRQTAVLQTTPTGDHPYSQRYSYSTDTNPALPKSTCDTHACLPASDSHATVAADRARPPLPLDYRRRGTKVPVFLCKCRSMCHTKSHTCRQISARHILQLEAPKKSASIHEHESLLHIEA